MRPLAQLVAEVEALGFRLAVKDGRPQLLPPAGGGALPAGLMAELKAGRGEILMAHCRGCGRFTPDREDRERLAGSAFCDRADCPYKRSLT
jgi:hypothetical protein